MSRGKGQPDSAKPIVVAVMVDALRFDYVEKYSKGFLKERAALGTTAELVPTFAFEPDAAYLAGLYPEESDDGARFWRSLKPSPLRWPAVLDSLPSLPQVAVRRCIDLMIRGLSRYPAVRSSGGTARIPFRALNYFEDRNRWHLDDQDFCRAETIFDVLRRKGRQWRYFGFPKSSSDARAVAGQLRRTDLSQVDFVFAIISNLDHTGHQFGPDSPQMAASVERVERWLQEMHDYLSEDHEDVEFIVFGDHGMSAVDGVVNVQEALADCSAEFGKEYVYFLDSTLARFWFFDETARGKITRCLESLQGVRIIDTADRERYRINYPHNRYGDLVYWVDAPRIILPNYFQGSSSVKGMHGYRSEVRDNHAAFIRWSSGGIPHAVSAGKQSITFVHSQLLQALRA